MIVSHDVTRVEDFHSLRILTVHEIVLSEATDAELTRDVRILDAAVLQIEDKAPALFAGPAPLNTNQSDIGSYQGGT